MKEAGFLAASNAVPPSDGPRRAAVADVDDERT